ncbi:hypothetical protein E2C01_005428 [Portunus trituberculatus]|uniref:Uncharacterized protein n=1 Tax=Portunus trituberculatus TaxID=210409 RepID=A0A5B7CZ57_PORTR|nr:hypothetical protein [Portunus trituberculatus]
MCAEGCCAPRQDRALPGPVYSGRNGVLWSERSVGMGDWHQLPERFSQSDCEGGVVTVVSVAGQVCGDAQVCVDTPTPAVST